MTLQEAAEKNWQFLLQDRNTKKYFLFCDSDNYGYDCYSFNSHKKQEDGFIPFSADMCCCNTKEEFDAEQALIDKWNEEMSLEERVDFCLKGMGSSLNDCDVVNNDDLIEKLFEKC